MNKMKKNILSLAVMFVAFAFAFTMITGVALAQTKAAEPKAKSMTITGKVVEGKIVADNGKEYAVENDAKGKELMKDHMGHKVEVKGAVSEKDGKEMIKISSIKHLSKE
jgi:hypothetical protein